MVKSSLTNCTMFEFKSNFEENYKYMVEIGRYNKLRIVKEVEFGLYLDGQEEGEILLPKKYVTDSFKTGETIEVFIYKDSEDRIIATTEKPFAVVGEFSFLEVVSTNKFGAFLNWGLVKDLLVPFSEQKQKMIEGTSYLVYIYFDKESKRIVASSKLDKFLDNVPGNYEPGEQVEVIIAYETEIGYKAIVNNLHWGLFYKNEISQRLLTGEKLTAFISNIRDDEKIDLSLYKPNLDKIDDIASMILKKLEINNGFLPYTDRSNAEDVYKFFMISKKTFKKTIGNLYRRRLIIIESDGIRAISKS